jgi:UDP-N-acetylglucosamine acyltransferase
VNIVDKNIDLSSVKLGSFNTLQGNIEFGKDVEIGNCCTIVGDIKIGDGTKIDNNVTIINRVVIGKDNHIYSNCSFGYEAQHLKEHSLEDKSIVIGDNNTFRENSSVHMPFGSNVTKIGNNNYIMLNVNIPHDAILGDNIVIAYNAAIGGHCKIGNYVNIGLNSTIHQRIIIGDYAMIGMGCEITKDVLPFLTIHNQTKKVLKINKIGFERNFNGEISLEDILKYKEKLIEEKSLPFDINKELSDLLEPFKDRVFYV